ncbi:hypothetical protein QJS10_CPA10g01436 [Acorus calamus]|uniref:Uncharacterized protein n=1 Tax=Acorus calamus TaxID=4465 RepID=A0AAV9E1E7_ACOCL|nr:hypothetical protein QJS10_CPA10g01436 [Acorus calamus]
MARAQATEAACIACWTPFSLRWSLLFPVQGPSTLRAYHLPSLLPYPVVRIKVEEADKTYENNIKDAILKHFQQACGKKV